MVNTITVELLWFKRNYEWIVAIIFSVVVVFTVGLALSSDVHNIPTALQGDSAITKPLEEKLDNNQFSIAHPSDVNKAFRQGDIRIAVTGENHSGSLYFLIQIDASEQSIKNQAKWNLEATIRSLFAEYPLEIQFDEKYGGKGTFAYYAPGVLALTIFTGGLFGASEAILMERERKTLDNIITSPTSPTRFIGEKIAANTITMGITSAITAALTLALGADIPNIIAALVLLLIAQITFISMGVAVSAFTPNLQVSGEINAVIMFPMMFFSGTFFSIYMMDPLIQNVGLINPLTYLNEAWRTLLLKGGTLEDILFPLLILSISALISTSIAIGLMWRLTRGMQQ